MTEAFAMGSSAGSGAGGGGGSAIFAQFLMILVIMALFYFILIRPQQKQAKKHEEMLKNLKKGDRVLTSGGLYGIVVGINEKDNLVVLRISDEVKVEVSRSYIASVKSQDSNPAVQV